MGRVLRRERPETRIVVCEPDNSPLLGSGLPQPRHRDGTPSASHPRFRRHLMQGWSPDFIAALAEDAVQDGLIDQILRVNGEQALRCSRDLACAEGVFVGISGGAKLAGALEVARSAPAGSTVLCMPPDTGARYLSTSLFADVPAEMSPEEKAISTRGEETENPTRCRGMMLDGWRMSRSRSAVNPQVDTAARRHAARRSPGQ